MKSYEILVWREFKWLRKRQMNRTLDTFGLPRPSPNYQNEIQQYRNLRYKLSKMIRLVAFFKSNLSISFCLPTLVTAAMYFMMTLLASVLPLPLSPDITMQVSRPCCFISLCAASAMAYTCGGFSNISRPGENKKRSGWMWCARSVCQIHTYRSGSSWVHPNKCLLVIIRQLCGEVFSLFCSLSYLAGLWGLKLSLSPNLASLYTSHLSQSGYVQLLTYFKVHKE